VESGAVWEGLPVYDQHGEYVLPDVDKVSFDTAFLEFFNNINTGGTGMARKPHKRLLFLALRYHSTKLTQTGIHRSRSIRPAG